MASHGGFGSWRHLAARFFAALSPAGPPAADEAWALGFLLPAEGDLWRRMSGPDRRHALGVARSTLALLGSDGGTEAVGGAMPHEGGDAGSGAGGVRLGANGMVPREVVAAALLHDVGKVTSGLGTWSRAAVTLLALAVGRAPLLEPGARPGGPRARIAAYLEHDRLGADLLRSAGSHPLTVTWAEEHHRPPARWTLEPRLGNALKTADGD